MSWDSPRLQSLSATGPPSPNLTEAVMQSIPAHVAVLDAQGVILAVNEAWRKFAAANSMAGDDCGVGQNYLALCESASGDCSAEAPAAASGIRGVIAGELREFVMDYPCHAPGAPRWFRLIVSPLDETRTAGALVLHINITGPERTAQALRDAERAARESEQRLSFALDAAKIGDWSLDLRTNATHRSLRHDQCFGYTDLLPYWGYDTFLAHIDEIDRARVHQRFQAAMAGAGDYDEEFRTTWKDGSTHWLWSRGRFYFDDRGAPWRVAGIVMDISERKRVEAEAERALDRLTEAQSIAGVGDWDLDLATQRIEWSDQVFTVMGRDPRLGAPQNLTDLETLLDSTSVAIQAEHVEKAISTKSRQDYDLVIPRRDATRGFAHVVALPRTDAAGQVVGLYGTVQDITERKRAEATQEQLASIVASSNDAIIGKDLSGIITSWNRGAQRVFGYSSEEMLGRSIMALVPDDRRGDEPHILDQVRRGIGVEHFETVRRRKDGRLIEVSITASPIRDGSGAVVGVSKVARDISERKRLEVQALRMQRVESIGTLAGGIAHDLNNVLTPIILSLEMLRETFPDEEGLDLIATIERSANHGADMVRQVLSFAKGIDGARLDVDIGLLLRDLEKMARDTFLKIIDVKATLAPDLWHVMGDPTQLHQVFLNLSVNARDAMPAGGSLTFVAENVSLDAQYMGLNSEAGIGPYVCIRVTDTGVGIPPAVMAQIFDPFFTTKAAGKGTGLGLSTSAAIVKSHGGFIRVYSEPGRGSTLSVYLPARTEKAEYEERAASELPRGRGELVLVVDDEPGVRTITQRTLEMFGYRVLLACDGAEAVGLYARHESAIAVVLTDMTMPVMDGPATIRVLRKMRPDVKVIGTSGLDTRTSLGELGVRHFLHKPYPADTLLKMLRDAIEGRVEPT